MRRLLLALVMFSCGHTTPTPRTSLVVGRSDPSGFLTPTSVGYEWTFDAADAKCPIDKLTVIVPFLEGLAIHAPMTAIPQTGHPELTLAYPGPLSMPMVAWSCDGNRWTSVHTTNMVRPPVRLRLRVLPTGFRIELRCVGDCRLRSIGATGTWTAIASKVATEWPLLPPAEARVYPMTPRYTDVRFYVHDFIDTADAAHPKKTDLSVSDLGAMLSKQPAKTLAFVYGLDPGGVDLDGVYLTPPADTALADIRRAAPDAALYHWLNLRTYKYAIPVLKIDHPPPPEIRKAARHYANGTNEITQYAFKAIEMCIASKEWQASRLAELDRLIAAGFQVIALDEFPTEARWDGEPCASRDHLHRPSDPADEWDVTLRFIRVLQERAARAHVLLGSEEPSTALVGQVSAYMDGTYNDPPDMYDMFAKSALIERIPLFSTMFSSSITPITRPSPKKTAPSPWITMRKVNRSGMEPPE